MNNYGTIFPEHLSPQQKLKIGARRFMTIMEVSIGLLFLRSRFQFDISKKYKEKSDGLSVSLMNEVSQFKRSDVEIDGEPWQRFVESIQKMSLNWVVINKPPPLD